MLIEFLSNYGSIVYISGMQCYFSEPFHPRVSLSKYKCVSEYEITCKISPSFSHLLLNMLEFLKPLYFFKSWNSQFMKWIYSLHKCNTLFHTYVTCYIWLPHCFLCKLLTILSYILYNPKKPFYTVSVFSCHNIFNYSFLFYFSSSHSQRPTSNRGHGSTQRRRLFIQTWRLAQPQLYLTAFKTTYETDLVRERKRSELWLMPDNKRLIWIEIFWVPIIKALKMIDKKVRPKLWKSHIVNGSPPWVTLYRCSKVLFR